MNDVQTVAVLGASTNPERYSNKAVRMLLEAGHTVVPINPALDEVEGCRAVPTVGDLDAPPDTLTVYLAPERVAPMVGEIVAARPGRVILNPGTENPALEAALDEAGIPWQHACTLVLLRTNQF